MNAPRGNPDSMTRPVPELPGLPDLTELLPKDQAVEKDEDLIKLIEAHLKAKRRGEPTIDPMEYSALGRKVQAKKLGLEPLPGGRYRRIGDGGKATAGAKTETTSEDER